MYTLNEDKDELEDKIKEHEEQLKTLNTRETINNLKYDQSLEDFKNVQEENQKLISQNKNVKSDMVALQDQLDLNKETLQSLLT